MGRGSKMVTGEMGCWDGRGSRGSSGRIGLI